MRTEPTDLAPADVARELATHWGVDAAALTYVPLGFGSHHWRATGRDGREWFVTVDNHRDGRMGFPAATSVEGLGRALRTAATLRDVAGLPFVLPAVSGVTGELVHRIVDGPYSIALFPFVAAERAGPGRWYPDEAARQAALGMVGRVHAAIGAVPPDLPRRDDLTVPGRSGLLEALAQLDEPWMTGPYGEPTRQLLREHGESITRTFAAYDALAAPLLADQSGWVVTHGEPHAGNVLLDVAGDFLLIDWDTVAIGPPERDLWMLVPESGPADWSAYTDVTGVGTVSEMAIRAYRMWWDLSETATFVAWFRRPHTETTDTTLAWGGLSGTFPLNPDYFDDGTSTG